MTNKPDRPHDTFFKETFGDEKLAAAELRSVLPVSIGELFDWTTLRVESGTFQTRKDKNRFCDLLFSVRRVDIDADAFVFVLFEHQSTDDALMALRVLRYMLRIWDKWLTQTGSDEETRTTFALPLPPILPVVLSHDERGWRGARRFHDLFAADAATRAILQRFVPSFEFLLDDLSRMTDDDLTARQLPPAAALSLWALRDGRSPDVLYQHLPIWAPVFAVLARLPGGKAVIARIVGYIGEAAGDRSPDPDQFARDIGEHDQPAGEAVMDSIEKFREQGRKEGHLEGARTMLLKQLRHFGEPTQDQVARIRQADEATLDRYAERIRTADSIEAVLGND
jgi:hypothetical protein